MPCQRVAGFRTLRSNSARQQRPVPAQARSSSGPRRLRRRFHTATTRYHASLRCVQRIRDRDNRPVSGHRAESMECHPAARGYRALRTPSARRTPGWKSADPATDCFCSRPRDRESATAIRRARGVAGRAAWNRGSVPSLRTEARGGTCGLPCSPLPQPAQGGSRRCPGRASRGRQRRKGPASALRRGDVPNSCFYIPE